MVRFGDAKKIGNEIIAGKVRQVIMTRIKIETDKLAIYFVYIMYIKMWVDNF